MDSHRRRPQDNVNPVPTELSGVTDFYRGSIGNTKKIFFCLDGHSFTHLRGMKLIFTANWEIWLDGLNVLRFKWSSSLLSTSISLEWIRSSLQFDLWSQHYLPCLSLSGIASSLVELYSLQVLCSAHRAIHVKRNNFLIKSLLFTLFAGCHSHHIIKNVTMLTIIIVNQLL